MSSNPVRVLAHRQSEQTLAQALGDLCRKVETAGWLAGETPRVVVQVGQRWRSSLVVETAKSLAAWLAGKVPRAEIELRDAAAHANGQHAEGDAGRPFVVAGITADDVRIPEWWFESRFVITVAGAGPARAGRLSGVLDAQAEPLQSLGNQLSPASLAYEAHRLFASDLAVACATLHRDGPTSEACWFVGPSDVAVEMALMRASGCEPSGMPYIQMLASHEILPVLALEGIPPRIGGYLAPQWQARGNALRTRWDARRQAALRDARAFRRNLWRIPSAVRRRLSAWRRKSA